MGVMNISINPEHITVDFKQNKLIFIKFGIPYHIIPISQNYQIIKKDNSIYQIREKTIAPNWFPKGYHNLSVNEYGFYQILNKKNNPYSNYTRLFFVDTTSITEQDIHKISNYTFQGKKNKIPDSFWFYPDYLQQKDKLNFTNFKQILNYYDELNFLNNSRPMTELEYLCLYIQHHNIDQFTKNGIISFQDENLDISYHELSFNDELILLSNTKGKNYKIYKSNLLYENESLSDIDIRSLHSLPIITKKR